MSGSKEGAKKATKTIYEKYGKDFYKIQGAKGGKKSRGGGFTNNPDLATMAGIIGAYNRWHKKEEKWK